MLLLVLLQIKEREQPFGHHQSQRYMQYKQVDEDELHFLQQELVQMLEYQVCEELVHGLEELDVL